MASNVNFAGPVGNGLFGPSNANHGAIPIGDDGTITAFLHQGSVRLILDVEGYFS